jgi:TonB family protein
MSIPSEHLKKWEGRVVDGKFFLEKWLGGTDHSVVFLTARGPDDPPRKAAIKLVSAAGFSAKYLPEQAQLSRWRETASLSHPNLIRIFECGRATIDHNDFLYLVMEFAEEDLGQILPERALSVEEVSGMLPVTVDAISFLHQSGFVSGRVKPSNVMAVGDQLKIAIDGLGRAGERPAFRDRFDAPELDTAGLSSAADVWSLGFMLVTALTQNLPTSPSHDGELGDPAIPGTVPQPFLRIAEHCLRIDPGKRCALQGVLAGFQGLAIPPPPAIANPEPITALLPDLPSAHPGEAPAKRNPMLRPVVTLLISIAVLIAAVVFARRSPSIPRKAKTTTQSPAGTTLDSEAEPPAPDAPPQPATAEPGKVLHQVLPDFRRPPGGARPVPATITVQVSVNASGNVTRAKMTGPATARYYAKRTLAAARRWKFVPPKVGGKPSPSEWAIRFDLDKSSRQASPTQIKP